MGTQPDAKLCNDVQAVSRTAEDMAFTHGIIFAQFSCTDGFACREAMLALQKQRHRRAFRLDGASSPPCSMATALA